ncbi:PA3715 family protein [Pseudomonas sp. LB1P83]
MLTVKNLLNSLALLGLITAVSQAQAGCEEAPFGERTFTICKVWPAYDDQTIVASSTFKPDSADANNDGGNVDLELSLIHSPSSKRLATYHKKDAYYSDAVAYAGLSIDTARYKLTPDSRAFGIRSSFEHSSSVNPYHKIELALYLKEGDTLRPVLEGLVISTSRGEWDGNCAGEGERTQRTVDIGNTTHNGFADLNVSSTVTVTTNFLVGEECKDTSSKLKTTRVTLNYDGKKYVVPEALKG